MLRNLLKSDNCVDLMQASREDTRKAQMPSPEAAEQPPLQRIRCLADAATAAPTSWITPEHLDELRNLASSIGTLLRPTADSESADGEQEQLWEAVCDLWVRCWPPSFPCILQIPGVAAA